MILLAGGTYTIVIRNQIATEPVRGVEQVFTIVSIPLWRRLPPWKKNTLDGFPFPVKVGAPPKDNSSFYDSLPKMQKMYNIEDYYKDMP